MQKICVMGLGYIGLPTAALLAAKGFAVHGVDVAPEIVGRINQCAVRFSEPDLDVFVRAAIQSGNLRASQTVEAADTFLICVPTPFKANHEPDLSYVESAARAICPVLRRGNLVVVESTVPPFTCERLVANILAQNGLHVGEEVFLAHCPERVLLGNTLKELVENDRIVGGINELSAQKAVALYATYVNGRMITTSVLMAETCKLVENAYRDVNIAFANSLQLICHRLGLDVWELIAYANRHPRVNIAQPGPGVGGHCIAVDPWFLAERFPEETTLIRAARTVNDRMPSYVADRVVAAIAHLPNPVIGLLGMTYKEDIDDIRESPSLVIWDELRRRRVGDVWICDPHVAHINGTRTQSLEATLAACNVLVVLVAHEEFRQLPWDRLTAEKVVCDFRNITRQRRRGGV